MINIEGTFIVKENVRFIRVAPKGELLPGQKDDRDFTIKVFFNEGSTLNIGRYSTKGYAQEILNKALLNK